MHELDLQALGTLTIWTTDAKDVWRHAAERCVVVKMSQDFDVLYGGFSIQVVSKAGRTVGRACRMNAGTTAYPILKKKQFNAPTPNYIPSHNNEPRSCTIDQRDTYNTHFPLFRFSFECYSHVIRWLKQKAETQLAIKRGIFLNYMILFH